MSLDEVVVVVVYLVSLFVGLIMGVFIEVDGGMV